MVKQLHRVAAMLATLTIALFFGATVLVELMGSPDAIAQVKRLIVSPGLWLLVPAIAAAGGSGFVLSKSRHGRLVAAKKPSARPTERRFEIRMVRRSLAAANAIAAGNGSRIRRSRSIALLVLSLGCDRVTA